MASLNPGLLSIPPKVQYSSFTQSTLIQRGRGEGEGGGGRGKGKKGREKGGAGGELGAPPLHDLTDNNTPHIHVSTRPVLHTIRFA